MTFQENIPAGPDNPSISPPDFRGNFQALETWSDVDHVSLVTAGADNGKHKHVHMPAQGSPPTTIAGEGVLYCEDVAGTTQLFFERDADVTQIQLTGDFDNSSNGYIQLAGPIIMQWGQATISSGATSTNVTLAGGITTLYSAQATTRSSTTGFQHVAASSVSGSVLPFFRSGSTGSSLTFYYVIIGV